MRSNLFNKVVKIVNKKIVTPMFGQYISRFFTWNILTDPNENEDSDDIVMKYLRSIHYEAPEREFRKFILNISTWCVLV